MTDDELRSAMKQHAYLEGEFVLRSGKTSRYYLDKYRFETRPDLLRAIGERLAAQIAEHDPEATLIGGPELGAVALAAAASLVRHPVSHRPQEGEGLRDGQPARGRLRARRQCLPRRGRRHHRRRARRGGPGGARGGARLPHGYMRCRP